MGTDEILAEISTLDASEKILLVEEVWDSVASEDPIIPLSEAQISELQLRIEEYRRNPNDLLSWEDVRIAARGV